MLHSSFHSKRVKGRGKTFSSAVVLTHQVHSFKVPRSTTSTEIEAPSSIDPPILSKTGMPMVGVEPTRAGAGPDGV